MRGWRLGWSGEVNAPGIGKLLSVMDEAQGPRTHLGNTLGFGSMDNGASMEITPIDMLIFVIAVALLAMWIDK